MTEQKKFELGNNKAQIYETLEGKALKQYIETMVKNLKISGLSQPEQENHGNNSD